MNKVIIKNKKDIELTVGLDDFEKAIKSLLISCRLSNIKDLVLSNDNLLSYLQNELKIKVEVK